MRYPLKSFRLALLFVFTLSALLISPERAAGQAPDDYTLVVSPEYLEFTALPGDTLTDSLYISEADSQIVHFEIYNTSNWLFLPQFFTCPTTPIVIPLTIFTGLAPGVYYDTITAAIYLDCQAWHSEVKVPVELTVVGDSGDYVIETQPTSFQVNLTQGEFRYDSLFVYEKNGHWVPFVFQYTAPWLEVTPYSPVPPYATPMTLGVLFKTDSLAPGIYVDTIFIEPDSALATFFVPVAVPVFLTVEPQGPVVKAIPDHFAFSLNPGGSAMNISMLVYEEGGGAVRFTAETVLGSSWLYIHPLDTLSSFWYTPDSVYFDVIAADLTSGVYADTIVIYDPLDDTIAYEDVKVPVVVTVSTEETTIATVPGSFHFALDPGDSIIGESLYVYETHGQSIDFWVYNNSPWLVIDTMSSVPLVTPKTIFINVFEDTLPAGTYFDTIFIVADDAVNSPLAVPVSLTVGGGYDYSVHTWPTSFHFHLTPGEFVLDSLYVYEVLDHSIPFMCSNSCEWLSVEPYPGPPYLTPTSLEITCTDLGLVPGGIYADTIVIEPALDSFLFPTVRVPVAVTVSEPGTQIVTIPDHFHFTIAEGDSLMNQLLFVYEQDGAVVEFWAEEAVGYGWLTIQPGDSLDPYWHTPDSVVFDIRTGSLPVGSYADSIVIYSTLEEGGFEPVKVPVFLEVAGAEPTLKAIPEYFDIALCPDDTLEQSVFVYEENGDSVPFWPVTTLGSSWLRIRDQGIMHITPDSVHFSVITTGLEPGLYSDTIAYYDDYQDSLPAKSRSYPQALVPVVLRVLADTSDYVVETQPVAFNWTLPQGGEVHDSLHVYEKYDRRIIFMFYNSEAWLTVYDPLPEPPYITPMSLHVFADASSLEPGTYTDTIVIQPEYEMFETVRVPVVLTVEGGGPDYAIDVMPQSFLWMGGWGYDSLLVTERFGRQVMFDASTSQLWLQVVLPEVPEFTTPSWVNLHYHEDTLPAGVYTDTVVITPVPGAHEFEVVKVPVVFMVGMEPPDYVVQSAPTSFNWIQYQGTSAFDTLHVYEMYGRPIGFLHYNRSDWLTVDPFAMPPYDYVTPRTLPVGVWTDSLAPGVYEDTIFITPDVDSSVFPTVAIPVSLTIAGDTVCGDFDRSGFVNILDVTAIINFLYKGGPPPTFMEIADADGNGTISLMDVAYLINYLYKGGPEPWCP